MIAETNTILMGGLCAVGLLALGALAVGLLALAVKVINDTDDKLMEDLDE